jgi:hypothetical protein
MERNERWERSIDPVELLAMTFHSIAERTPSLALCSAMPPSSLKVLRSYRPTVDPQVER